MPCLTNQAYIKLPSIHCKSLSSLIRNCVSSPSELSSEDESSCDDLDTKQVPFNSPSFFLSFASGDYLYYIHLRKICLEAPIN